MGAYFYIDLTGWLAVALFGITVVIAIFFRRHLTQHFGIGYGIAALSFLHASLAVDAVKLGGPALYGIIAATVGMFVSWGQVGLGSRMRLRAPENRGWLRYLHAFTAVVLVILGAWHLVANSPHLALLLRR